VSIRAPIETGTIKPPIAAAPTIHAVACADSESFSSTKAIMVGYCGPEANPKSAAPIQIDNALTSPTIMMIKPKRDKAQAPPTIVSGFKILLNGIATKRASANEAQKIAVTSAGFEPDIP